MSEKKNNNQEQKESTERGKTGQSEKEESFDFLQETIKPKRIGRRQRMTQLMQAAVYGVILGGCACLGFFALKPLAQRCFPEKAQTVTIPEDKQQNNGDSADNEETPAQDDSQEQTDNQQSYTQLMENLYGKVRIAKKTVVSITKGTEQENWSAEATGIDETVSGVIMADNGQELLILSDARICEDAKEWCVTFSDNSEYKASLKRQDKNSGFAVFAVAKEGISDSSWNAATVASLGNSNLTEQGDTVFALGSMFGYAGGTGYGIVSSTNYKEMVRDGDYGVIATDISCASDGTGVLFNQSGEVIGMISSEIWKDRGMHTANAYAISDLKSIMQLLANGASVPYFGISGTSVTNAIQQEEGMPAGIYVIDVAADSPAMAAGIQSGDVICEVNGNSIASMEAYRKTILTLKTGDQIKVKGKRQGSGEYVDIDFSVTVGSKE